MNRKQYTALAFALVGAAALSAQAVAAKDDSCCLLGLHHARSL